MPSAPIDDLFMGPFIAVRPALIKLLGGHDLAIVVQHTRYLTDSYRAQTKNGHRWAVLTNAEWCDECALTAKQLRRVVAALTDLGVIVREQIGRTTWTRVDDDGLARLQTGAQMGAGHADPPSGPERAQVMAHSGADQPPIGAHMGDPFLIDIEDLEREELAPAAPTLQLVTDHPLTSGQKAKRIVDDYWLFVQRESGRKPTEVSAGRLMRDLTKLLDAGVMPIAIARAMEALYRRGAPIIGTTIGAEVDGRARRAGSAPDIVAQAKAIRFDAHGNLAQ